MEVKYSLVKSANKTTQSTYSSGVDCNLIATKVSTGLQKSSVFTPLWKDSEVFLEVSVSEST